MALLGPSDRRPPKAGNASFDKTYWAMDMRWCVEQNRRLSPGRGRCAPAGLNPPAGRPPVRGLPAAPQSGVMVAQVPSARWIRSRSPLVRASGEQLDGMLRHWVHTRGPSTFQVPLSFWPLLILMNV